MPGSTASVVGRFAPSPTGPLHLGNLRTALAACLSARSQGGSFRVRFEDLDRITSSRETALNQLRDLGRIGIDSDAQPVWQSERFALYEEAIRRLGEMDLVYECYCSRREVSEAAAAPHDGIATYPGTCRDLDEHERRSRRAVRPPALRLRSDRTTRVVPDLLHGPAPHPVDDVVLRRNDGVPSYNLAVVVDDALQNVTEVVRGGDLLAVSATQIALGELLGFPPLTYVHLPLVTGRDGQRLSKRHGAVTIDDLVDAGWSTGRVRSLLLESLGQRDDGSFDLARVPLEPYVFVP